MSMTKINPWTMESKISMIYGFKKSAEVKVSLDEQLLRLMLSFKVEDKNVSRHLIMSSQVSTQDSNLRTKQKSKTDLVHSKCNLEA